MQSQGDRYLRSPNSLSELAPLCWDLAKWNKSKERKILFIDMFEKIYQTTNSISTGTG